MLPGDCDGDGRPARGCGGDDCDDDDALRFPGNTEVCDAAGHDEDCDPDTFARASDGDRDGDGFIDAACCNGTACGDDCDDDDVNRNPSASESCDGIDNDCDGAIDVSAAPLCPGGVCYGGRCDLTAWDRTFGDTAFDGVNGVAIDVEGNVYAGGDFSGTVDFGGGPATAVGQDLIVVSYTPDGVFRWQYTVPLSGTELVEEVAVDESGTVYAMVRWESSEPTSLGGDLHPVASGEQQAILALHATDGSYAWDRLMPFLADLDALRPAGVVALGSTRGRDLGGGVREDGEFLARYDGSGAWIWDTVVELAGTAGFEAVDARADTIAVTGIHMAPIDLGGGILEAEDDGDFDFFVGLFNTADGSHRNSFSLVHPDRQISYEVTLGPESQVFVAGVFRGSLRVSPSLIRPTQLGEVNSFIISFLEDGSYVWDRVMPSDNSTVNALATDTDGNLVVVGRFRGLLDLGGGLRSSGTAGFGFAAQYSATGLYRFDRVYGMSGTSYLNDVAIGPANSSVIGGAFSGSVDFGSGPRVSAGAQDGFLFRPSR